MKNNNIIALKIENAKKSFNKKFILNIDNLTIKKGEKVALIGPSGAGKTTLLNLMSGTLICDTGNVIINDRDIHSYKSNKELSQHLGILRQQFDLVNELSVLNNVLCGRFNKWGFIKSLFSLIRPFDKSLALETLETVGLADRYKEITENLSGGEQQRVAISRLLLQNPTIVLCDEPVSSLDPSKADEVLKLLTEKVHSEERTLIATLHSVSLAKKYFDRIIAMKNGTILFDIPTTQLHENLVKELYNV